MIYQNDGHENYTVTWAHVCKWKNVGFHILNSTPPTHTHTQQRKTRTKNSD